MAITKTYSMKEKTVKDLEEYAKNNNIKMSVIVDEALKTYLESKGVK